MHATNVLAYKQPRIGAHAPYTHAHTHARMHAHARALQTHTHSRMHACITMNAYMYSRIHAYMHTLHLGACVQAADTQQTRIRASAPTGERASHARPHPSAHECTRAYPMYLDAPTRIHATMNAYIHTHHLGACVQAADTQQTRIRASALTGECALPAYAHVRMHVPTRIRAYVHTCIRAYVHSREHTPRVSRMHAFPCTHTCNQWDRV